MNTLFRSAALWGLPRIARKLVNLSLVSQWEAVEIVRRYVEAEMAGIVEPWPEEVNPPILYGIDTWQSWIIRAPWGDGKYGTVLRSSRVVLVDRRTGKITYDGSANDEG